MAQKISQRYEFFERAFPQINRDIMNVNLLRHADARAKKSGNMKGMIAFGVEIVESVPVYRMYQVKYEHVYATMKHPNYDKMLDSLAAALTDQPTMLLTSILFREDLMGLKTQQMNSAATKAANTIKYLAVRCIPGVTIYNKLGVRFGCFERNGLKTSLKEYREETCPNFYRPITLLRTMAPTRLQELRLA